MEFVCPEWWSLRRRHRHHRLNDPDLNATIHLQGNDCGSVDEKWDDLDGWFECGSDCDDNNDVNPSAQEVSGNVIDDDCDEESNEEANPLSEDNDGDGYESEGDCDDNIEAIHPDAIETLNQIDDNCDGYVTKPPNGTTMMKTVFRNRREIVTITTS